MTKFIPSNDSPREQPTRPGTLVSAALVAGSLISLLSFGMRSAFGLFTEPYVQTHQRPRELFVFAMALQNIAWGISQPVAGYVADRVSTFAVLAIGGLLYAAGVAWMVVASMPWEVHLSATLTGIGMGGASFVTVSAALQKIVPEPLRAWAVGIVTASGSLGQFVVVPLIQALIDSLGWVGAASWAALVLATIPVLAILVWRAVRNAGPTVDAAIHNARSLRIADAMRHRSYQYLVLGFFACGFQLAFITAHLPLYLIDIGIGQGIAAWALGIIGLFNIIGAYVAGSLCARHGMRRLLVSIYLLRAALIVAFLMISPTPATVLVFAIVSGLTWLSTVPPTSGLIVTFFGTARISTLFGIVFLSHQIGAFFGVWLGSVLHEATGSYQMVWWLCVVVSVGAALLHLSIRERAAVLPATVAA